MLGDLYDDLNSLSVIDMIELSKFANISQIGILRICKGFAFPGEEMSKKIREFFDMKKNSQEDQWDESLRGQKMSSATGNVIFKYQMPVLEEFTMKLPLHAQILRVDDQDGMFWMWALVNTNRPDEVRKFRAFKTGAEIPNGLNLNYIGFCKIFVQMELGLYIFEEHSVVAFAGE